LPPSVAISDTSDIFIRRGCLGGMRVDDSQELNYPAIVRAIAEAGFEGFLGQEFIPTAEDPFASLEDAMRRCRV
jgi:hydroxypyruvate isomerase